jgi:hypothetical protein
VDLDGQCSLDIKVLKIIPYLEDKLVQSQPALPSQAAVADESNEVLLQL